MDIDYSNKDQNERLFDVPWLFDNEDEEFKLLEDKQFGIIEEKLEIKVYVL